jgi:mannose-6-phosphate isomerase-like protein (cupin superfamily)
MVKKMKGKANIVKTGWGYKEMVANLPAFGLMVLNLKKDKKSSIHHHFNKVEMYYVLEGRVSVNYLEKLEDFNKDDLSCLKSEIIGVGESFLVPPPTIHQILALEDSKVIEVSTQHVDKDMIRLVLGD